MAKFPFNNDSTPRERRAELLKSGDASTYHTFATGEDPGRGRYSEIEKFSTTGAAPVTYPALQSEGSPWASRLPDEPPIDATDCGTTFGTALGEMHEQFGEAPSEEQSSALVEPLPGVGSARHAATRAPSPTSKRRKR